MAGPRRQGENFLRSQSSAAPGNSKSAVGTYLASLSDLYPTRERGDLLRPGEETIRKLQEENYDLRLSVHHLEVKLAQVLEEHSQVSQRPPQENFYSFDNDDSKPAGDSTNPGALGHNLHEEVQKLTTSSRDLDNEVKRLERQLSAEKRRADYVEAKIREEQLVSQGLKKDNRQLNDQLAQVRSERIMVKADLDAQSGALSAQITGLQSSLNECEERVKLAEDNVRQSTSQLNICRDQLQEREKRVGAIREHVSVLTANKIKSERELEHVKGMARQSRADQKSAEQELERANRKLESMSLELGVAKDRLNAEKSRRTIQDAATKHSCSNMSNDARCFDALMKPSIQTLEDLVRKCNPEKLIVSDRELHRWRDTVLSEINSNLTLLYCFQRQVEQLRDDFVEQFRRRTTPGSGGRVHVPTEALTAPKC